MLQGGLTALKLIFERYAWKLREAEEAEQLRLKQEAERKRNMKKMQSNKFGWKLEL